jgi:hypothetical protein
LPSLDDQIDHLASLINNSPACWKLLYMHHSPYSVSNAHRMGDTQADLATFINALRTATHNKIDVVLSGHHHAFEYMAEPTATPSGPTPQIRYVTDGKGGSSDRHTLAPPVSGVVSVYSDSDPEHRGWLLVQAWTGQAAPSNLRLTYNVVQRKSRLTPGPTPADWRDRWLSGTVMLVDEAKNCYDHPLTCSSGPCTPGTEEPVATSCTPSYPSSCGGADELHVDAKHPFACPTEVQLIQAHVEAAACCDEPTCPDDTSPCPVKAEGYDAAGHMVAAYCMAQQTVTHRYRVDTGRVFDKWTVPAYWRIIRNDTAWHPQCDPYLQMVWYSCCDCTRNYDID